MRRRTFLFSSLGAGLLGAGVISGLPAFVPARRRPVSDEVMQSDIPGTALQVHAGAAIAFGTTISVRLLHQSPERAKQVIDTALREAKKIDALMSLYREDSQLSVLNRQGWLAQPDPHLLAVMTEAQRLAGLSDGAFDPTVQPLWRLYADAAKTGNEVASNALAQARHLVGWQNMQIDAGRIAFALPGMAVTLNGIAQGYASDLAVAAIRAAGVEHALIDIGEFSALGRNASARPWTLGVQHPRDPVSIAARLRLDGRSMATSGDYESTFTGDFSAHHIFDPATGRSPVELASVTVLAPTCMLADGLSTAMLVAGPTKSLALAADLNGVDALLIGKDGTTWQTPGLPLAA